MASVATWGGDTHPDNEVKRVKLSVQTCFSSRNQKLSHTKTLSLFGEIQASSVTDIVTRINEIESAYSQDGRDFRYTVNGVLAHSLLNDSTNASGTNVVSRAFPRGDGAELATQPSFSIVLQATYDVPSSTDLVSWQESVETIGTGGPKFHIVETE